MEADGKKFTKPQQKKYDMLKGRVERGTKDVEFDSKGRAYFSGSHRSAAKGLGGVNDQYVVSKDGNVMHYMNDENDLFGFSMPGDKRVVTVTPPAVYNVFKDKKSSVDTKGKAVKEEVSRTMQEKYGATTTGTSRDKLRTQMGESIMNYDPKAELQDYRRPAKIATGTGGLLTYSGLEEE